jgi:DNA repair exonuclease SbcCD ATPase subunit
LALLLHPAAASIFGRNSRGTAAIFGNLLGNRDNNSGRHPSPPLPSSPHHATNWDAPPPPPPPPPPPRVSEDGTVNVILTLQQREQIHLRQLNVLTERIMEMEAITAAERNQLLEWQENCTSLINQMASLEEEASEDRKRCQELTEQYEQGVATQNKLKDELKVALRQAEDLAALIERHRLQGDEDGEDYETFRKKKKKRKRGFFAWLFGWGREDDDSMDNVDEVYEQARSTLLKALQTERNNVDELEMAVASLQQNNSAIAEQVQSRDLVIEQLNNRVAVFEDDKVVLKAALKQLQKEMKEEAPKTLKLAEDAKQAQQEIERLKNEIEAMIQSHKQEIARLQKIIAEKEMHVQESLGNLTEIGTYVDKLESRLADFAVARRDMEKREEKCQELEELSKLVTEERDALKTQLTEYETEREEHKHLLQELVEERTSLKSQTDRGALEQNAMRLRGSLAKLEIDYKALDRTNIQLQSRIRDLESQQSGHDVSQQRLEDKLASTDKRMEELQSSLVSATQEKKELSEKLSEAEKSKDELLKKVDDLTKSVDDYSSPERAEESRVKEVATREIQMALQDSLKLADSMREQLRDKQSDLDHTKYELETVRQAKQTLEAKLLEHAQRSMDSSAASTSTVCSTLKLDGYYQS